MTSYKISNICFFNHYHNGDLFHGKEFIKDIIKTIPVKYYYAHRCHSNVLADLDAEHCQLPALDDKRIFAIHNDTFFINTWIGAYFGRSNEDKLDFDGECTLRFLYAMYRSIYRDLNGYMLNNLVLKDIEHYYPQTDYSKYFTDNINTYLEGNKRRKVLISNGPALSGQCDRYNDKMKEVIIPLAKQFPEVSFIATHKITTDGDVPNLEFTNDIIQQVVGCDLNEISYLSTHCDLIVGRNSGPFCFCTTKQNMTDSTKTFYAFGDRETDCFYHGLSVPAKFIFAKYDTVETVITDLEKLVGEIK